MTWLLYLPVIKYYQLDNWFIICCGPGLRMPSTPRYYKQLCQTTTHYVHTEHYSMGEGARIHRGNSTWVLSSTCLYLLCLLGGIYIASSQQQLHWCASNPLVPLTQLFLRHLQQLQDYLHQSNHRLYLLEHTHGKVQSLNICSLHLHF